MLYRCVFRLEYYSCIWFPSSPTFLLPFHAFDCVHNFLPIFIMCLVVYFAVHNLCPSLVLPRSLCRYCAGYLFRFSTVVRWRRHFFALPEPESVPFSFPEPASRFRFGSFLATGPRSLVRCPLSVVSSPLSLAEMYLHQNVRKMAAIK